MPRHLRVLYCLTSAALLSIALAGGLTVPARSQPTVDGLLARIFGSEDKTPYELIADFNGTLTLVVRGTKATAVAAGSFVESRGADGVRKRKVNITRLDLPILLRPFGASVRRIIEEKVETQSESPETFHEHDIFILGEQRGRYVLVGVQRAIVDAAIDRYGKPEDKRDPEVRRRIARWLWTSPQRENIVRPGPPYALRVTVDEAGLIYELTLFYNWGEVGTRISYVEINKQAVWRTVSADAVSEVAGFGRVDGVMVLNFTNHCVNCKK
ncbi:MAG TPA: hypothetical protein VJ206_02445 [bacterium]|nr:hypothetical protein [bacterium]